MFTSIKNIITTIIYIILAVSIIIQFICWIIKKNEEHGIYILINLSITLFIIVFICYNEKAISSYKEALDRIEKMYIDQDNTISNHNEINKRILFLEERIAHYQNNSNNFASLWLALLSVLFITVTGFNLYNYNEKKKEIDKLIKLFKKRGKNVS